MGNYNSMAFTPDEVKKGMHLKFLTTLLELNSDLEGGYYDIHITSDGYCTIIEWCECFYESDCGEGRFGYIPTEGRVVLEKFIPDGHYEDFESEEAYDGYMADWQKEHPEWKKTKWGTWTNEEENKKFADILHTEEGAKEDTDDEEGDNNDK